MTSFVFELIRKMRLAYYRAALNHLHPSHEDVPSIVQMISHIEDQGSFK